MCVLLLPPVLRWLAAMAFSVGLIPAFAQGADSETLKRIALRGFVTVGYIPTPGTFAFEIDDGSVLQGPPTRPLARVILEKRGSELVAIGIQERPEAG